MTSNLQNTRPTNRPSDGVAVEPTPVANQVTTPSGVTGVAVYDQGSDVARDSSLRTSASMVDDPTPVKSRSSGAIISWIIGIVVLLVLAYFFLQMVF